VGKKVIYKFEKALPKRVALYAYRPKGCNCG